ncbi:unnamed protein product [Pipistrellus nathusii]|uniref:Uncharacterized protein n=1 Tax=Pipistrellus nathusii TaxID=59473 RepID=A0ABN9ZYL8_PIPNA
MITSEDSRMSFHVCENNAFTTRWDYSDSCDGRRSHCKQCPTLSSWHFHACLKPRPHRAPGHTSPLSPPGKCEDTPASSETHWAPRTRVSPWSSQLSAKVPRRPLVWRSRPSGSLGLPQRLRGGNRTKLGLIFT